MPDWGETPESLMHSIDAKDKKIKELEAEVAALRKRLVIDDAMIERANNVIWDADGRWADCMRAALDAALRSQKT